MGQVNEEYKSKLENTVTGDLEVRDRYGFIYEVDNYTSTTVTFHAINATQKQCFSHEKFQEQLVFVSPDEADEEEITIDNIGQPM